MKNIFDLQFRKYIQVFLLNIYNIFYLKINFESQIIDFYFK